MNTIELKETGKKTARLKEIKGKSRHITDAARYMLWGRAAGRCQFSGCNRPLWKNPITQEAVNIAQAAHIYAFSVEGPRGNEGIEPNELNEFENLLLVCHGCHKTIDDHQKGGGRYAVEQLRTWKTAHEERIERVTGMHPDCQSHVILYGKAINGVDSPLRADRAATAMFARGRFPAERQAIELCLSASDSTERDADFWQVGLRDLERRFSRQVHDLYSSGEIAHLSIFALAPMPLLIRFGTLLTDIRDIDVYQLHREPKGWTWPAEARAIQLEIKKPNRFSGTPALVISLSATIEDARIKQVLGEDVAIWRVTLPKPNQECLRSKADLAAFTAVLRPLMDEIKASHGHAATLSIFPAAPVSAMIELGRLRQAKAEMNWIIYDENRALGGFTETLKIESQKV